MVDAWSFPQTSLFEFQIYVSESTWRKSTKPCGFLSAVVNTDCSPHRHKPLSSQPGLHSPCLPFFSIHLCFSFCKTGISGKCRPMTS
jgi:hypothetical protein